MPRGFRINVRSSLPEEHAGSNALVARLGRREVGAGAGEGGGRRGKSAGYVGRENRARGKGKERKRKREERKGKNNTHATYGTRVIFRALVLGLLAAG
jgi:hypothetical protein